MPTTRSTLMHTIDSCVSAFRRVMHGAAVAVLCCAVGVPVWAQVLSAGTVVQITGISELRVENDQAVIVFVAEEQDRDRAVASGRANQRIRAGMEQIRKDDPGSELATRGFSTFPIYADDSGTRRRTTTPIAWRVVQSVEYKSTHLGVLPGVVTGVQKQLALQSIQFGLSETASKNQEGLRIDAAYRNLVERTRMVARAMGQKEDSIHIEEMNFDLQEEMARHFAEPMMLKAAARDASVEPGFEPGFSTLVARITAKVRIK